MHRASSDTGSPPRASTNASTSSCGFSAAAAAVVPQAPMSLMISGFSVSTLIIMRTTHPLTASSFIGEPSASTHSPVPCTAAANFSTSPVAPLAALPPP